MKYPSYPRYKDSGVEWLGEVPEHWEVKPLFTQMLERDIRNNGNLERNVLSLSYGKIVCRDVESNFGLLPESFETYQIVEPNNIILRLTDLQNDQRSLRVGQSTMKGIITSAYVCLEPLSHLDPLYAFYLLNAYDLSKIFYGLGGGVRQSMGFKDLKRLPLVLPPPLEQKQIARFLERETTRIDALIAKQEHMLTVLEEKRKALISHAVTRGLRSSVGLKDSGVEWMGQVPEHWEISLVKHIFYSYGGGTPTKDKLEYWNGDIPWVSPKDMKAFYVSSAEDSITKLGLNSSSSKLVDIGSVLVVVRSGILQRTIPVAVNVKEVAINQDMKAFTPKNSRSIGLYLFWLLCGLGENLLPIISKVGATVESLDSELMANMHFPLPPLFEQEEIVQHLDRETAKLDALTQKVRSSIVLMREHRTALIAAAVTGKIDVRATVGTLEGERVLEEAAV